ANLLFGARRFADAKEHVMNILKQNPNEVGAQLLLASSDAELGNLQAAMQEAQKAVEIAPNKQAPYLTVALMQERNKHLQPAEEAFRQATVADPKSLSARLALGGFYQ